MFNARTSMRALGPPLILRIPIFLPAVQGIMLVFDLTDEMSFTSIHTWIAQINEHAGVSVRKVLVGTKAHLVRDRKVSKAQGKAVAADYNFPYFEVSARDGLCASNPRTHAKGGGGSGCVVGCLRTHRCCGLCLLPSCTPPLRNPQAPTSRKPSSASPAWCFAPMRLRMPVTTMYLCLLHVRGAGGLAEAASRGQLKLRWHATGPMALGTRSHGTG